MDGNNRIETPQQMIARLLFLPPEMPVPEEAQQYVNNPEPLKNMTEQERRALSDQIYESGKVDPYLYGSNPEGGVPDSMSKRVIKDLRLNDGEETDEARAALGSFRSKPEMKDTQSNLGLIGVTKDRNCTFASLFTI